jgi:hypothetical protein
MRQTWPYVSSQEPNLRFREIELQSLFWRARLREGQFATVIQLPATNRQPLSLRENAAVYSPSSFFLSAKAAMKGS